MKIAKVVGNVVSTIKDKGHAGYKLLIVEFLNEDGTPQGPRQIAFDAAHAGPGDMVLVSMDGGAANMLLDDGEVVADLTVCGVLDSITMDGRTVRI